MFLLFLIFYVFSVFSKFEHQNFKNIENYKLVIWIFGNLNPIPTDGPELTIQTGGGQKHLRFIIGPYLGHFKSDFIRVKTKLLNYTD